MDGGVKIAAACGVLLAGSTLALLFRHPTSRADRAEPQASQRLLLRKTVQSSPAGVTPLRPRSVDLDLAAATASDPGAADGQSASPRTAGQGSPPPELARRYPDGGRLLPTSWGNPDESGTLDATQTHKIIDGDTLPALAQRYLGSADRYLEIYEANRDVLPSPQVLPIGAKLKIPPPGQPASASAPAERPLVPVTGSGATDKP
jgi:nucleoid-associated protein YgaU